jgi:two-component system chemotaxis response regulator CheB
MTGIEVIVVGSSAGGVAALRQLVAALPADFSIPLFIVQHMAAGNESHLPQILSTAGALPVIHPCDGQEIKNGVIYIALPDHHMLLDRGNIIVRKGPKENRFRPSIDALFRSAAYAYGSGTIGIVLTGMLDDGSAGMKAIDQVNGITIVQDPKLALYPSMPLNVLKHIQPSYICALPDIAPLLTELTCSSSSRKYMIEEVKSEFSIMETDIAILRHAFENDFKNNRHIPHTCPQCGIPSGISHESHSLPLNRANNHRCASEASLIRDSPEQKLRSAIQSLEEAISIVEQQAAAIQMATRQPSTTDLIKIRALKKQANELYIFLTHYLQIDN